MKYRFLVSKAKTSQAIFSLPTKIAATRLNNFQRNLLQKRWQSAKTTANMCTIWNNASAPGVFPLQQAAHNSLGKVTGYCDS
uniref:Uncharacterized protein n=1 Tax=Nelumbo nucifera TaxID=4432 RepID=A0A822XK32_NELNU|nr:TPA_asm: hypothetical protein HUJ06_020954 [Nelumbo nucifera]